MHTLKNDYVQKKQRVRERLDALQQRPARLNANGEFMSSVRQDGTRKTEATRRFAVVVTLSRRLVECLDPFHLSDWLMLSAVKSREMEGLRERAHDEKQIEKPKYANDLCQIK